MPKLVGLSRFLSDRKQKQRLLSTRFGEQMAQAFRPVVAKFHAKVNEGRWGSVAFAIPEVLKMQVPLKRFWDLESFRFGQPDTQHNGRQDEAGSGVKLDLVNEAIESPDFWAQLQTLDQLFEVVRDIFEWVESCRATTSEMQHLKSSSDGNRAPCEAVAYQRSVVVSCFRS